MPTLLGLIFVVAWNTCRGIRGKSTICSSTRRFVPATVFVGFWAGLSAWILPHWLLPRIRAKGWF